MQLSEKQKTFSPFFFLIWISRFNFENFQKKDGPYSRCISELTDSVKRG